MTLSEIVTLAAAIIASVGGGGAIILFFAKFLGKIFADKYVEGVKHGFQQDIEQHKTRLKKSEFLFEKEFEAVSAFIALRRRIEPPYNYPEKDWDEACEEFARDYSKTEKELQKYISVHGAAMKPDSLEYLSGIMTKIARHKFDATEGGISREGLKIAGELMDELEKLENELCKLLRSQTTINH